MGSLVVAVINLIGLVLVIGLVRVGMRGEHEVSPSLRRAKRTGLALSFAGLIVTGLIAFGVARWSGISGDDPRVFWFFLAASFGIVPGFLVIAVQARRIGRGLRDADEAGRRGEPH